MALAKGHSPKTKSHVSDIRTIGPLVYLIIAQNIDLEYTLEPPLRGGSNEYPQSMFWRNNKNKYTLMPQLCYIKVGFKGVNMSWTCHPDDLCYVFTQADLFTSNSRF